MEKIYNYRPARYLSSRNYSYVVYSVLNPETGRMMYRRIKLNYIKSKRERKQYAEELVKMVNAKLANGYNPFTDNSEAAKLILLSEAINDFLKLKRREMELHNICADSYKHYVLHLSAMLNHLTDVYVYKIKTATITSFLDALYIENQVSSTTVNNYLATLKIFFTYCQKRDFLSDNPTAKIRNMKVAPKKRQPIPAPTLQRIFEHLRQHDKHYLLACYLLYACFIRPSEICQLKLKDVSFKNQTIYIDGSISKNRKSQVVTIPRNVALYMIELQIYNVPNDFYLIGHNFAPSDKPCNDKILRRKWLLLRQELRLPDIYQFYSLKDTGITQMISTLDVTEVRDQARHHSISITDVYTDRTNKDGNSHIKAMDFAPRV